jgi:predicted permease
MDSAAKDLRYAWRSLARRPLFTSVAIVTLALGTGGTTAMFSVVDGVLIRDLPYDDPSTLVSIWKAWPDWRGQEGLDYIWDHIQMPWADYLSIRSASAALDEVAAFQRGARVLYGRGAPRPISVGFASANLFDLLGVAPVLGRDFGPDEVPPDGGPAPVVVLSHEIWTSAFGADEGVVGASVRMGEDTYEVIGVLPRELRLGSDLITMHENGGRADAGLRDVWLPLGSGTLECGNCFEMLGRLAPGRTVEEARDEVQSLLVAEAPGEQIARVEARKEVVTRGYAAPLLVLLAAAGVLLVIACTNVAGLLLGEAATRGREVAVRSALGAGRWRIARQLLTESVFLGLVGAAGGVAVAFLGMEALLSLAPPLPRLEEVEISVRVLAFAIAAGVGTGIVFGLAPALTLARRSPGDALRTRGGDRGSGSMHRIIASVQVGLTVVLLVIAGLFGRSLHRVMTVDPGFDAEQLATLGVELPVGRADDDESIRAFHEELIRAVEDVPGVEAASGISALPFPGGMASRSIRYDRDGEELMSTQWVVEVHPSYFETVGIPLLQGRSLSEDDVSGGPSVMVVSRSLADRNWPDGAVGARLHYHGPDWSVVGVVGDVRQRALGSPPEPTLYTSTGQMAGRSLDLVVRTSGEPGAALPAIMDAVWSVDPDIPISDPATMVDLMRSSEADDRFRAVLMWVFAALAIVLASVGIFGVTARSVAARTTELGIRTALGARSNDLVRLVVRDGLRSSLAGTALGLVGAYWAANLIGHLLYGIDPHDRATFAASAALATAVCLGASLIPALRVSHIDPATVIAEE